MRRIRNLALLATITIALTACGSEDLPSFIDANHISKVEVANNTSGRTSTATSSKDNLNELLNMVHLSDITTGSRTRSNAPPSPAFTVVLYDRNKAVLKVLIPRAQNTSTIFLQDDTNSERTGSYSLKHAIASADLQSFIAKYPD